MALTNTNEKKFKIFILSENLHYRNALASKLRLEGFFVEFSTGGFHLLHIFELHKNIDMIIFNDNMEDMPTHEIVTMLRHTKNKNELPIIFVSEGKDQEEIAYLELVGVNEHILKTNNLMPIIERANMYSSPKKVKVS